MDSGSSLRCFDNMVRKIPDRLILTSQDYNSHGLQFRSGHQM